MAEPIVEYTSDGSPIRCGVIDMNDCQAVHELKEPQFFTSLHQTSDGSPLIKVVGKFRGVRYYAAGHITLELLENNEALESFKQFLVRSAIYIGVSEWWIFNKADILSEYRNAGFPCGKNSAAVKRWWFGEHV